MDYPRPSPFWSRSRHDSSIPLLHGDPVGLTSERIADRIAEREGLRGASRGAIVLTATGTFVGVGNLAFSVLVARLGGTGSYGALGPLLAFAAVAAVLTTGVEYAVARRVAVNAGRAYDGFRLGARASAPWLVLALIFVAMSPVGAAYLRLSSPLPVMLSIGLALFSVVSAVPFGILLGQQRYRALAIINVVAVLMRLAMVAPLARWLDAATAALLASLVPVVVILGALLALLSIEHRHRDREEALDGGSGVGVEGAIGAACACGLWMLWSLPLLFARHSLSDSAAGRFAAAQSLFSGVLLLTGAVATAFFPVIAARRTRLRALVVVGFGATLALMTVGVGALVALGPMVIRLLYGVAFQSDRLFLLMMGVSVGVVGVATYAMWASRAIRSDALVVGTVGVSVAFEIAVGVTTHGSMLLLAATPALCLGGPSVLCLVAMRLRGWAVGGIQASGTTSTTALRGAGLEFGEG